MNNALSIDLEEWYHPELIREHAGRKNKNLAGSPVKAILTLLEKYSTKATFFVLGEAALADKELVKLISGEGHEIACHGLHHLPLWKNNPSGFKEELFEFRSIITDILGNVRIKGFRAPSFSLTQETAWAIDVLKELDFKYDSSIFPVKLNNLYGIGSAPLGIYDLSSSNITIPDNKTGLKEFPLTVFEICGLRIPVSGGFYLRVLPIGLQKIMLKSINKKRPFIIYLHPWECHKDTPRVKLKIINNFISYYNIKSALARLEILLNNFKFDRVDKILGV